MRRWLNQVLIARLHIHRLSFSPLKVPLLFAAAVLLTLALSNGNALAGKLFQSPQSPALEPVPPQAEAQPAQAEPAIQPVPTELPGQEQAEPEPAIELDAAQPASSQPAPAPVPRQPRRQDPQEEADQTSSNNFVLDRGELVDTIVVSTAYVWLCCGIILLLLLPLAFLFLQIRGRSKIKKEDIP